ncbi:MAG: hypothetical protein RSB76_03360 [Clostridia bacterium]
MTVEELDIIVKASIEPALKELRRMIPEVKKTIQETSEIVSKKMSNIDTQGVGNKVKQVVSGIKQQFSQMNSARASKTLETQFNKASLNVQKYQNELEQTKTKLNEVYAQMDNIQAKTWKQYTPDGIEIGNKAVEPSVNNALNKDNNYQSLISQEIKLNGLIDSLNSKLLVAQKNYSRN